MAKKTDTAPDKTIVPQNLGTNKSIPPVQQDQTGAQPSAPIPKQFPPTTEDENRLSNYGYFDRLFMGEHFEAFSVRIRNADFTAMYAKLRYIKANFAGLLSKIMADMLFSEPINIKVKNNQNFVDAFVRENNLNVLLYESELTNSSLGDSVFKLRVGPRNPDDESEESSVILDQVTPRIYFPDIDPFNVSGDPKRVTLAWKFKMGDKEYLRQEIHSYQKIENRLYLMDGNQIKSSVPLSTIDDKLKDVEEVKIDECLVIHVPNWRTSSKYFGVSDYYDLDALFYAINNRFTMIDNILDKHSDPILMVPPGVIDKDGKVNKKALGVVEYEEGSTAEPKYIVWDASLENAFKEIEKLIETMFMISETSPDILGMGQGQSDSGRALKFKLMRTIAKARRKRLYYDHAIKEMVYRAQLLAKAYNATCDGVSCTGEAEYPEIEWQDGLPQDDFEAAQIEQIRQDSGTTSKKDSIMRLDAVDEKTAEAKVKEIDKETAIPMPAMNPNTNFDKSKPGEPKTTPPKPADSGGVK